MYVSRNVIGVFPVYRIVGFVRRKRERERGKKEGSMCSPTDSFVFFPLFRVQVVGGSRRLLGPISQV